MCNYPTPPHATSGRKRRGAEERGAEGNGEKERREGWETSVKEGTGEGEAEHVDYADEESMREWKWQ